MRECASLFSDLSFSGTDTNRNFLHLTHIFLLPTLLQPYLLSHRAPSCQFLKSCIPPHQFLIIDFSTDLIQDA